MLQTHFNVLLKFLYTKSLIHFIHFKSADSLQMTILQMQNVSKWLSNKHIKQSMPCISFNNLMQWDISYYRPLAKSIFIKEHCRQNRGKYLPKLINIILC